ncbi:hypothetical protein [Tenacibaculum amylolyticum]|uniref:hypothetical protein n=1 Tax=Tenacibaculum amylolyticum TaxID=104269 RepID=UPI0038B4F06A
MEKLKKELNWICLLIGLFLLLSCSESEGQIPREELTIESKIEVLEEGEWLLKGFEDSVMYTFKNGKRYTHYGENGQFEEPIPTINNYFPSNSKLSIDFNSGTIKEFEIALSCNNNIVELSENNNLKTTLYKHGTGYMGCLE